MGCQAQELGVIIVRPQFTLSVDVPYYNIFWLTSTNLKIDLDNQCRVGGHQCGGGHCPPPGITFSAAIVVGAQYGTLAVGKTGDRGSAVSGLQPQNGEFDSLYFIADGIMPDFSGSQVIVRVSASDPGVPPLDVPLMIEPGDTNPWDHYIVYASPDTIARKDTTKLTVIAVDYASYEVVIPSNTQLTFSLDSVQYGSFINASGQRVSSPLSGILYGDARAGRIKFFADGLDFQPDSFKTVHVQVSDGTRSGSGSVVIGRKKLRILDHSPWKIWPYLPPQSSNGDSRGADLPGYNPKRAFTIEVKDARGRLAQGQSVTILTSFIVGSGGHGHAKSKDTVMSRTLQGSFWKQGISDNPLSGLITDANGRLLIDSLRASQFSGAYIVTARLAEDTTVFDTVRLSIRIDNLVEFGSGSYWDLAGVPGNDSVGMNHISNHWCTQMMKDTLAALAQAFYEWTADEGGGTPLKLQVNDMSLEWGGAFDFPGRWVSNSAHSFH